MDSRVRDVFASKCVKKPDAISPGYYVDVRMKVPNQGFATHKTISFSSPRASAAAMVVLKPDGKHLPVVV